MWIRVEDAEKIEGEQVLGWNGYQRFIVEWSDYPDGGVWMDDECVDRGITHVTPLPPPPTDE